MSRTVNIRFQRLPELETFQNRSQSNFGRKCLSMVGATGIEPMTSTVSR